MAHHTRLSLRGTALLALLALPGTLGAQDATRPAPAPEDAPVRLQGAQVDPAEARRAAAERAEAAIDRGPVRREIMSKLRDEEVRHRERLATIHRLRQIAESQGQAERLALLDKLEVKEGARYNAATQLTAVRLGNTTAYKQTLIKLADGRIRKNVPAEEPEKPKLTPEERAARQAAKRAGSKAAQPEKVERPKPEEPKADAPKSEAPKAQRQQAQRQQANAQVSRPGAARTEAARAAQPVRRAASTPGPARRTETRKPASRGSSGAGARSPRSDS